MAGYAKYKIEIGGREVIIKAFRGANSADVYIEGGDDRYWLMIFNDGTIKLTKSVTVEEEVKPIEES